LFSRSVFEGQAKGAGQVVFRFGQADFQAGAQVQVDVDAVNESYQSENRYFGAAVAMRVTRYLYW